MWIKWTDLNSKLLSLNKKIVFYGRSEDWIPKALKKIDYNKSKILICDNNKNFTNTIFHGVQVKHRSFFDKIVKKFFFIITSSNYSSIANDLKKNGLRSGTDFVCLPEFYDFAHLVKMRSSTGKILLSSSDESKKKATRYSGHGGGIFLVEFDEMNVTIKKIINGSFRQISKKDDGYFCANYKSGDIYLLDKKFKIKKIFKTKINTLCGIDYNEKKDELICVSSVEDCIYLFSCTQNKIIKKINFKKSSSSLNSNHHINDVKFLDDQIFITFFSATGSWKQGLFDGGIAKLDLNKNDEEFEIISNNSTQPHSPEIIDGSVSFCDSCNMNVILGGQKKPLNFNGYVRGLDQHSQHIFVGQSETMYLSRMMKNNKLLELTSGIHIVNYSLNVSRFLPTFGICNIHDIKVINFSVKE